MCILLAFALLALANGSPIITITTLTASEVQRPQTVNESHLLVEKLEEKFKDNCLKYGGNDTFAHFLEAKRWFIKDVQSAAVHEAMVMLGRKKHLNSIDMLCTLKPTIKEGLNKYIRTMKSCVNPQKKENLNVISDVTGSLMSYICTRGYKGVTAFLDDGGVACLKEHQRNVLKCVGIALSDNVGNFVDDADFSNEIDDSYEAFSKEGKEFQRRNKCRKLFELEKCVNKELNQCGNPSSSKVVTGLLDSIMPICSNYRMGSIHK